MPFNNQCLSRYALQTFEEKLNRDFFRCHKSFVVNISKIERISPVGDRLYEVSFHKVEGKVTMGRKPFEQLCSKMSRIESGLSDY